MTCYFRHLNGVFAKAEIEVTKENKRELNMIIKGILGDGDCPLSGAKSESALLRMKKGLFWS